MKRNYLLIIAMVCIVVLSFVVYWVINKNSEKKTNQQHEYIPEEYPILDHVLVDQIEPIVEDDQEIEEIKEPTYMEMVNLARQKVDTSKYKLINFTKPVNLKCNTGKIVIFNKKIEDISTVHDIISIIELTPTGLRLNDKVTDHTGMFHLDFSIDQNTLLIVLDKTIKYRINEIPQALLVCATSEKIQLAVKKF